jgi:hypothetical protein
MLNDARTKAETLERQSREKAASLERDAARKHTEIIGPPSQEKSILEKKIDELRAFERGYRTRLKTYLDAQLRELGGHGVEGASRPDAHPAKLGGLRVRRAACRSGISVTTHPRRCRVRRTPLGRVAAWECWSAWPEGASAECIHCRNESG